MEGGRGNGVDSELTHSRSESLARQQVSLFRALSLSLSLSRSRSHSPTHCCTQDQGSPLGLDAQNVPESHDLQAPRGSKHVHPGGGAETNAMQALAQQIVALRSENVALQEQSALKSTRSENVALQEQLTSTRGAAPAAGSDAGAKRAAGGTHTGGNAAKRARNEVEVDCSTQGMSLQAGMAGLFRDRLLCDVTVIVGGSEFKAHACVLAAVSGYFRGLLVGACDGRSFCGSA